MPEGDTLSILWDFALQARHGRHPQTVSKRDDPAACDLTPAALYRPCAAVDLGEYAEHPN